MIFHGFVIMVRDHIAARRDTTNGSRGRTKLRRPSLFKVRPSSPRKPVQSEPSLPLVFNEHHIHIDRPAQVGLHTTPDLIQKGCKTVMKHDTSNPPTAPTMKGFSPGFAALGLEAALLTTLEALGYEEPTPIQREAIPPLLAGNDLLGRAATGTGKTAAFTLPLLQRLAHSAKQPNPSALILVPTRELAIQVCEAVQRYGKHQQIAILAVYGGQAIRPQLIALKRGVDIVVATPGRALDHIRRKTLQLKDLQIVVLDEADEMLNMGFAEDLDAILKQTPSTRQTALFSATMPPRIASIARHHLRNPIEIQIIKEPVKAGVAPRVHQIAYLVARPHKVAALARILDMSSPKSALVFCRTRVEVDELTSMLNGRGYRGEGLHGGMNQAQRDRVMQSFRAGKTELLVATDVAARGLDIPHVSHVVNYDVPTSPEAYVHRIGRTGRAGRAGEAITLVESRERWLLQNIERLTKSKIRDGHTPDGGRPSSQTAGTHWRFHSRNSHRQRF